MAAELAERVAGCDFGRTLHRLDITVTSLAGSSAEHARTQHVTFRPAPGGGLVEDPLYRNLHPMLAERIELWRLGNFALERLLSPEDIFLFRAVAHSNPKDVRLFAMAEVRDLTPALGSAGEIVGYPALERVGLQALAAMRDALAGLPDRDRPQANRIVLNVRPRWEVPRRLWPAWPAAGLRWPPESACRRRCSGCGWPTAAAWTPTVGCGTSSCTSKASARRAWRSGCRHPASR